MQKCAKKLIPPGNGALACDKWYGGKFCQMLCKEGYDVSPGKDFEEMLVCGQSGEWLPKNALPLPDCSSINLFKNISYETNYLLLLHLGIFFFRIVISKTRYLQNGCFILF